MGDREFRVGIREILSNPDSISGLDNETFQQLYVLFQREQEKRPSEWRCSISLGHGAGIYFKSHDPEKAIVGLLKRLVRDFLRQPFLRGEDVSFSAYNLEIEDNIQWHRWNGQNYQRVESPINYEEFVQEIMPDEVNIEFKDFITTLISLEAVDHIENFNNLQTQILDLIENYEGLFM